MKRNHVPILILVIIAGFLCIYVSTRKVEKISCYIADQVCDHAAAELLQTLKGSSLFFSDPQKVLTKDQAVLRFSIVTIKRELPDRLHVTIQESPALYEIKSSSHQSTRLGVSENGSVVSVPQDRAIPLVLLSENLTGSSDPLVPAAIHQSIKTIIDNSPDQTYQLETITYQSTTEIIVQYKNLPPLIVSQSMPVYALQHIEKIMYTVHSQQIQQPIKEIDLRFRLPVLRTET